MTRTMIAKGSEIEQLMRQAIAVAKLQGTPYGAVILHRPSGAVISAANRTADHGPTAHAEMEVLRLLKDRQWAAADLVMVSTGEPCPMCMGAIVWSQITTVYYGASIGQISRFHKQIGIGAQAVADASWLPVMLRGGILEAECLQLFDR